MISKKRLCYSLLKTTNTWPKAMRNINGIQVETNVYKLQFWKKFKNTWIPPDADTLRKFNLAVIK